jgi:hypothetical protein
MSCTGFHLTMSLIRKQFTSELNLSASSWTCRATLDVVYKSVPMSWFWIACPVKNVRCEPLVDFCFTFHNESFAF